MYTCKNCISFIVVLAVSAYIYQLMALQRSDVIVRFLIYSAQYIIHGRTVYMYYMHNCTASMLLGIHYLLGKASPPNFLFAS